MTQTDIAEILSSPPKEDKRSVTPAETPPYLFQRLEYIKERLATEYLPAYLDPSRKAWYVRLTATYLAEHLLEAYRHRVEDMVRTMGPEIITPHVRQHVIVSTTMVGTLTVQLAHDTIDAEGISTALVRLLETSDKASTWDTMGQRLATELSTWALEQVSQTLEPPVLATLPAFTLEEMVLSYVRTTELETLHARLQHCLTLHAQRAAFELAAAITTRTPSLTELDHWLGFRDATPLVTRLQPLLREDHLTVLNAAHYQAIREILTKNTFQRFADTPWPTAPLTTGPARGHAQLRPVVIDTQPLLPLEDIERWAQRMWRQRAELSDLDADALDALSGLWLYQARTPQDDAVADVDELLAMRGLRAKLGGQGRRGGYMPPQRSAMLQALMHIQNLWMNMTAVNVYEDTPGQAGAKKRKPVRQAIQSRAFTITDLFGQLQLDGSMDVRKFIFRPGKVFAHFLFGPGRQTALLSAKALAYDPYRQTWEKRLARYLSYQWRCRAHSGNYMQTFKVKGLLEAVGEQDYSRYPTRTKERFEKAFDRLEYDQVINGWQYDRWEEPLTTRRGWIRDWLQATILVEPPDTMKNAYRILERHEAPVPKILSATETLGEGLKRRRIALGLSQIQAAELLGISQAYLSLLERGKKIRLSGTLHTKLHAWLSEA